MNKLILKTIDRVETYTFDKVDIFTSKYKTQLNRNSLHVPTACKLIIYNDDILTALIMALPVIFVDKTGDIFVWTQTPFDICIVRSKKPLFSELEEELIKKELESLKAKVTLDFSSTEASKAKIHESNLELLKMWNGLGNKWEGGGF